MVSPIIFATFLAPAWYKTYQYITDFVERYVQVPTFLLNGESLDDFAAEFVDVGFISPLAYIQLLEQQPCPVELIAAPVALGADDPQMLPTFVDIVVRNDSRLTTLEDLQDSVWAFHVEGAHIEDNAHGADDMPVNDVRACVEANTQAQALRMVLAGEADATAIEERRLNLVLRNSPALASQIRVVSTYCPSPGPLVVVGRHVELALQRKIQEAFLTIHKSALCAPRLKDNAIDKFIFVSNVYYQSLREHHKGLTSQKPVVEAPANRMTAHIS